MGIIKISGYDVLVDDEAIERVSKYKWYLHTPSIRRGKSAYFLANIIRDSVHTTIPLHRFILFDTTPTDKTINVDHINRNTLDNRRDNLRIATPNENAWNRGKYIHSKSPYKGVTWSKGSNKWTSAIYTRQPDGRAKRNHLGYFDSPEDAAKEYGIHSIKLRGTFAVTNFPLENYTNKERI